MKRRSRLTTAIVGDVNTGASAEPAEGPLVISRITGNRRFYRYDLSRNTNTDEMVRELRAGRQLEVHEGNRRGPDITVDTLFAILAMRWRQGERLMTREELEKILLRSEAP